MSSRKNKYQLKEYYPFEATSSLMPGRDGKEQHIFFDKNGNKQADSTTNIAYTMLISDAFKDLTVKQRMLYVYAKSQFYGARSRPSKDFKNIEEYQRYDGRECFYLNHNLLSDVYNMYPKTNHRDLYSDIAALIEHGFIEWVTEPKAVNESNHMRTIYRYSEGWKDFKPGMIYIPENGKDWKWTKKRPGYTFKRNKETKQWGWLKDKSLKVM